MSHQPIHTYEAPPSSETCLAPEGATCTHTWTVEPAGDDLPELVKLTVQRAVPDRVVGTARYIDPSASEDYRAAVERHACQDVTYRLAYVAVSDLVDEAVSE